MHCGIMCESELGGSDSAERNSEVAFKLIRRKKMTPEIPSPFPLASGDLDLVVEVAFTLAFITCIVFGWIPFWPYTPLSWAVCARTAIKLGIRYARSRKWLT